MDNLGPIFTGVGKEWQPVVPKSADKTEEPKKTTIKQLFKRALNTILTWHYGEMEPRSFKNRLAKAIESNQGKLKALEKSQTEHPTPTESPKEVLREVIAIQKWVHTNFSTQKMSRKRQEAIKSDYKLLWRSNASVDQLKMRLDRFVQTYQLKLSTASAPAPAATPTAKPVAAPVAAKASAPTATPVAAQPVAPPVDKPVEKERGSVFVPMPTIPEESADEESPRSSIDSESIRMPVTPPSTPRSEQRSDVDVSPRPSMDSERNRSSSSSSSTPSSTPRTGRKTGSNRRLSKEQEREITAAFNERYQQILQTAKPLDKADRLFTLLEQIHESKISTTKILALRDKCVTDILEVMDEELSRFSRMGPLEEMNDARDLKYLFDLNLDLTNYINTEKELVKLTHKKTPIINNALEYLSGEMNRWDGLV